jgi:hypothetical protein
VSLLFQLLGSVGNSVSVGREYRLAADRYSSIAYLVTMLVEAQTLLGSEVGVSLKANENELEAQLCHYLTQGWRLF